MKEAVLDDLLVQIDQTVEIKASPEEVFEGLVAHLCELQGEDGKPPVKLRLERFPGGRWFRDSAERVVTCGDSCSRSSHPRCSSCGVP